MPRYQSSPYAHGDRAALGLLVVNLGTPAAPDTGAVRRYLAEFLSDPRVVELPPVLWRFILHGVILRTRPARSARAYRKIWTEAGSPLLVHSQAVADGLQRRLGRRLPGFAHVRLAMTYGEPAIDAGLVELRNLGVRRLLVLPLYPQYSGTTTASVFDRVAAVLRRWRRLPELRFINQYHDEPAYISALADSVRRHWNEHGRGERLLMSFHGVPRATLDAGDPYHCQCRKTARLLGEALELTPDRYVVCFQSRVGRAEWLRPYTDQTLEALAREGVGDIDVVCPGFAVDCLETLEEIAIQNAGLFAAAGGGSLRYIPALNDSDPHLDFLADLVCRHAAGWPELDIDSDDPERVAERHRSRDRALAMGADR